MTATQPEDVDEIAVERACNGDRTVHLNRTEVAEVFLRLTAEGRQVKDIAAALGVSTRTVVRWRAGVHLPYSRRGAAA